MRKRLIMRKTFLFVFASFLIFMEIAFADQCNPPTDIIHSYWKFSSDSRVIKDGDILRGDRIFSEHFGASGYLITEPPLVGCKIDRIWLSCISEYRDIYQPDLEGHTHDDREVVVSQSVWIFRRGGKYFPSLNVKFAPYVEERPPYSEGSKHLTRLGTCLDQT